METIQARPPANPGPLVRSFFSAYRALTRRVRGQQEFWLLGLAGLMLLILVAGRVEEHRDISRSRGRVAQAVLALQDTENVATLLLSAETSQRGYLLTGVPGYLEPYRQVLREMPAALQDFQAAARGVGGERALSQAVECLARAKLAETSETIRLYQQRSPAAALTLVRTNAGQQLMEQFWQTSKALKQSYVRVFTQESERLEHNNRRSLIALAGGSAVVLAVLVFSTLRLQRLFRGHRKLLRELQEGQENYRLLAQRLEAVREDERAHLAREIHDELGPTLTIIKLGIATAARAQPADLPAKLNEAVSLADQSIRSLRRIASELRPPLLDAVGLAGALRAYIDDLRERTGLTIQFTEELPQPPLSPDQRIAAYRICQESLTNVLRHSGASQASVTLRCREDVLTLQVQDNGRGFTPQETGVRRSLGLLGMEERARIVDGELSIVSIPGTGTGVTFFLPLPARVVAGG